MHSKQIDRDNYQSDMPLFSVDTINGKLKLTFNEEG